jgi:hypothetical protein
VSDDTLTTEARRLLNLYDLDTEGFRRAGLPRERKTQVEGAPALSEVQPDRQVQLLTLMKRFVTRANSAHSKEEARRRGVDVRRQGRAQLWERVIEEPLGSGPIAPSDPEALGEAPGVRPDSAPRATPVIDLGRLNAKATLPTPRRIR